MRLEGIIKFSDFLTHSGMPSGSDCKSAGGPLTRDLLEQCQTCMERC